MRKNRISRLSLISITLPLMALLMIADAQAEEGQNNRDLARAAFERGIQAVEREHWEEALEEFNDSLDLYPTQTALYNKALCLGLIGRPADAIQVFEDYTQRYGSSVSEQRRAEVQAELERLRGRVARVRVNVQGTGSANIAINGEVVGQAPMSTPLLVNPGRHHVTVQAEGFNTVEQWIEAGGGEVVSIVFALESGEATVDQQMGSAQPVSDDHAALPDTSFPSGEGSEGGERHRGMWIGAWASLGVAIATLGATLGLFLWNGSEYDTWESESAALRSSFELGTESPEDRDDIIARWNTNEDRGETIQTVDTVTWALLGTGIAASIASVVLFVLAPRLAGGDEGSAAKRSFRVAISPNRGGMMFSAGWNIW